MRHFIPIVNGVNELLPKAIAGCHELWNETVIIDNRHSPDQLCIRLKTLLPEEIEIYMPDVPLTTAQTMNLMLRLTLQRGEKYFTWQHLDGVLHDGVGPELQAMAASREEPWGVIYTHHDVFAAWNCEALTALAGYGQALRGAGPWDWYQYPYYFLDNDIHERLEKAGFPCIESGLGDKVSHEVSTTIRLNNKPVAHGIIFRASETLWNLRK
jgi:hypothetical protein